MAQLWKYITEINTTEESHEDSDQVVINQGGRSVQIPWSILKAGIENRITNIDNLLDTAVFIGEDEEEGYLEADVSIDAMKQEIVLLKESIQNLNSVVATITNTITDLTAKDSSLENLIKEQGNNITSLTDNFNNLPRILTGTVNPNDILEELQPKENDVYILASPSAIS